MDKVLIELLESNACAKCAGLKERVNEVIKQFPEDKIELKYLDLFDDQKRIVELGMYTSPALAVNGELYFLGKIPSEEELKNLISEKLGE